MRFFKRGKRSLEPTSRPTPGPETGFVDEALPHMDAVYRFALRLCQGHRSDAEDVLQEAYMRAYQSWHTYQPGTECRSWLFTICRNEFLKKVGRRKRKPEVLTSEIDADVESLAATAVFSAVSFADPEKEFFDSFVDQEVMAAVDRIPDPYREALVLSDLQGMAYPEISEILEVPIGTVKSRIFRARRLLQEALYEYALEMGYVHPKEQA
ncbi:MAG: sigma-70 family RNA polymerase sigma factor [Gemmatimonadota bacterium]|nr:sigma-70 family RNA polymerase sigma factor [Gemmatimonadota bacterium]